MRSRRSRYAGFTLIEIMIVVTITAALALLAAPRFATLQQRSALRSSRMRIESMLATARAAAIQKGRPATFWVQGNRVGVRVEIDDAGATMNVGQPVSLDSLHKVSLSLGGNADTIVVFNSRGFVQPALGGPVHYRLQTGSRRDSTCVSRIGHILGQTCVQ